MQTHTSVVSALPTVVVLILKFNSSLVLFKSENQRRVRLLISIRVVTKCVSFKRVFHRPVLWSRFDLDLTGTHPAFRDIFVAGRIVHKGEYQRDIVDLEMRSIEMQRKNMLDLAEKKKRISAGRDTDEEMIQRAQDDEDMLEKEV